VAATKSPVIFIGTGEHMDEFEIFDVKPFVSRLLGMGDWSGFMDKIHEVVPMDQQPELLQKLSEGNFTLRIMYEQFQRIMKMGPISQVFSMLPGFRAELMPQGQEKESQAKIKRYMTMMDSMTNDELDSSNPKLMTDSRIMRIARGAGCHVREVMNMLEEYKRLAKIWSKMKGLKIPKKGEMSALSRNMNAQHMSKVLPPQMLKQIGDGVLLIHTHNPCVNRGFNRILLWNPSIRKVFQVPPCNANAQNKTDINFGFGYDQVSNEYKVVAVDMKYCYSKTRVYRLGTDSWSFAKEKRSYPIIPKLFLKKFSSTTNFEGAIHWLGSDGRRRKSRYSHLLRFDLTTEAYTCIKLPDVEFKEYRKQPPKRFLSVLDRKLAILDIGVANVCIWVMENNGTTNGCSWTKQYNVDLRVQKFLYLKENGELLFYRKFQELLSYDFRNQQMKKLGRQSQQIIDFVDTYKESLVLLGGYI
ncbi:hypothetical protein SOVF_123090, partial [Spinacia oleracea]